MGRAIHKGLITLAELTVAFLVSVILWALLLAQPLHISGHTLSPDTFRAGEIIEIDSVSEKPAWAALFCTALTDGTWFVDNEQVKRYVARNPHDPVKVHTPNGLAPGLGRLYRVVNYACFNNLMRYQVSTDPEVFTGFYVMPEKR